LEEQGEYFDDLQPNLLTRLSEWRSVYPSYECSQKSIDDVGVELLLVLNQFEISG
jgi:hypothetical protein